MYVRLFRNGKHFHQLSVGNNKINAKVQNNKKKLSIGNRESNKKKVNPTCISIDLKMNRLVTNSVVASTLKKVSDNLRRALINQIDLELAASTTYLSMSHFFKQSEWYSSRYSSKFIDEHQQEMRHAAKLMNFLSCMGIFPNINGGFSRFDGDKCKDPVELAEQVLSLETEVLDHLFHIQKIACDEGRSEVGSFIDDMITDNQEEVLKAKALLVDMKRQEKENWCLLFTE